MATFETFAFIMVAAEDKFARDGELLHYTRITHVPRDPVILGKPRLEEGTCWVRIRLTYCTDTPVLESNEVDIAPGVVVTCLRCRGAYG